MMRVWPDGKTLATAPESMCLTFGTGPCENLRTLEYDAAVPTSVFATDADLFATGIGDWNTCLECGNRKAVEDGVPS